MVGINNGVYNKLKLYAPNLTLIRCVCHSAVNRIHNQWLQLKTHFGIVRDKEKCYTAQILFEMYNDDMNYAYISFLKPILGDIQRVNKAFEAKKT
jgi:hypothetical protein